MTIPHTIPVVDLFAGPGGLGEGFSSLFDEKGNRRFGLQVSIEKDPVAHRTLLLRAIFRAFPKDRARDCYYDYVTGKISREQFFAHESIAEEVRHASAEAICAELGRVPAKDIDALISPHVSNASQWVLIGGPPCQAYSLAGRSRRRKEAAEEFEKDEKHFLYKEYLRVIRKFAPSVFVMENVKGILSSRHSGAPIFEKILSDLSSPGNGLAYEIRSFVVDGDADELEPADFIIRAERFGVPQARHRVILFGVRSDVAACAAASASPRKPFVLTPVAESVSVARALSGLPELRSRLSKEPDSHKEWLSALADASWWLKTWRSKERSDIEKAMAAAQRAARAHKDFGKEFDARQVKLDASIDESLRSWLHDSRLGGVIQHVSRSHMRSDLCRYLFAACWGRLQGASPGLADFPPRLLPDHENVDAEVVPFGDRFRVQLKDMPSTTVVSHIAKDGHYYIHHDPSQCRSLTVREAARLQTFPDNYFFEGTRTKQYEQVGNAVPPWLARQIAQVALSLLESAKAD